MEIEVTFTQNQKPRSRSDGLCPTEDFRAWTNLFGILSLGSFIHRGQSFMCERQLFAYLIPAFKNCEERGYMFCVKRQCSCLVSNRTFKALQENKLESIYLYLKVFLLGDKMT